ncbi:protein DpdD [Aeromicrobium sp. A1-2]|uniref:protein DpdD n=1 Tax=Aeromicrobium sp. A1-2 TaxID=2107713 RepID=UPI0013C2BFF4|nr:protein DpdD [Aeromicrobium sp. A1-2]
MLSKPEFVERFFSGRNVAWEGLDPSSPAGQRIAMYLSALGDERVEQTVILPYQAGSGQPVDAYVMCPRSETTKTATYLRSFVGSSFGAFDGKVSTLRGDDPSQKAILEFDPLARVFILRFRRDRQAAGWTQLRRLAALLTESQSREGQQQQRGVARLLTDFQVALASGLSSESGLLLEEIGALGGLSGFNLSYLKIDRLSRLGRMDELRRLPEIIDVVSSNAPLAVCADVTHAFRTTDLPENLNADTLPDALAKIEQSELDLQRLFWHGDVNFSPSGRLLAGLLAHHRGDSRSLTAIKWEADEVAYAALFGLNDASERTPSPEVASVESEKCEPASPAQDEVVETSESVVASWTDWIHALRLGGARNVFGSLEWQEWTPPAESDEQIAQLLGGLTDAESEMIWRLVGPLVDSDDYGQPAWRSARALIEMGLLFEFFRPADLSGITALLDIYLRGAPSARDYGGLLSAIAAEAPRWVGAERAVLALDLVDVLARSSSPDTHARTACAWSILAPLNAHAVRLDDDLARFALSLSSELSVALEWPTRADEDASTNEVLGGTGTLLIYSLDEAVLRRTKAQVEVLAPGVTIRTSHDKVGSERLRAWCRSADAVAMATRCAKHAATGFIQTHRRADSALFEADGAGSASLLRAAVSALDQIRS